MFKTLRNNVLIIISALVLLVLMAYGIAAAEDYTAVYEANKPQPTRRIPWEYVGVIVFGLSATGFYLTMHRRKRLTTALTRSRELSRQEARFEDERRQKIQIKV